MIKQEQDYNIFDWWKKVMFKNYATFNGRARRKEYWCFILMNAIMLITFLFSASFITDSNSNFTSSLVFIQILIMSIVFIAIIPLFAVTVRRLHDTNKSGWFYFVSFIPLVGSVILFAAMITEGNLGKNQYGKDSKKPDFDDELELIGKE